jgi:5-bromo-4-chloroindolyl phosphate hydrolysis protein
MVTACDKFVLYFILVLGIIAVSVWTIIFIQLSQLLEQTNIIQYEHINGSITARENIQANKEAVEQNLEKTNINKKNIENILNNISEIKSKLINIYPPTN